MRGGFGVGRWHTKKSANELAIFLKSERWGRKLSRGILSPSLGHYFPSFSRETQWTRKKKRKARRQGTRFTNKVEVGEDKL